jgi:glycosyltransferase A (GT-A) superfamily protein (DUF2064 family)
MKLCIRAGIRVEEPFHNLVKRKAILVFAEPTRLDLARRRLPAVLAPLFRTLPLQVSELDADVHLFSTAQIAPSPNFACHQQTGATFADRLEAAVEKITQLGYEEVAIVGRDCPRLTTDDIGIAFDELHRHRLVLGPDHRGGCYLIALNVSDRELLRGIRWQQNTDCAELRGRCAEQTVSLLPVKHDLDSWMDVRLLARSADRVGAFAAALLRSLFSLGERNVVTFVDAAWQKVRARWQLPPPLFA